MIKRIELYNQVIEEENKLKQNAAKLVCLGDPQAAIIMIKGIINKSFYNKTAKEIYKELRIIDNMGLITLMNDEHLLYRLEAFKEVNEILQSRGSNGLLDYKEELGFLDMTITNIGKRLRTEFKNNHKKNKSQGQTPLANLYYINNPLSIKKCMESSMEKLDGKTLKDLAYIHEQYQNELVEEVNKEFKKDGMYKVFISKINEFLQIGKKPHNVNEEVFKKCYIVAQAYALLYLRNSIIKLSNKNKFEDYLKRQLSMIGRFAYEIYIEEVNNSKADNTYEDASPRVRKASHEIPGQTSMY